MKDGLSLASMMEGELTANSHATHSLNPVEGPFDGSVETFPSRTVRAVAVTNGGVDSSSRQRIPSGLTILPSVGKEQLWSLACGRPGCPLMEGSAAMMGRIS